MAVYRVFYKANDGWCKTLTTTDRDLAKDTCFDFEKDGIEVKMTVTDEEVR